MSCNRQDTHATCTILRLIAHLVLRVHRSLHSCQVNLCSPISLGGSADSGTRLSLFLSPRRFWGKFSLLHKDIGAKRVNI